ncbi:MAG: antiterminator LoaP [Clostridia bacterium]|nr:antiterminator LoaP [Clostridia bacterium]
MEWYAVFVETSKEEDVQKWLEFHFNKESLQSLVPKRKLKEKRSGKSYSVIKKLFPGYVFIRTSMDLDKYRIITSVPRLLRILNTGTYYSQIEDEEMSLILKLVGEDSIIDYSRIFIENSRVLVKDGPLYGIEGIIKKINKHTNRAKVQLNFMGEPRFVDVGIEILYNLD